MNEQVKWLEEHKFTYNDVMDEWRLDLPITGNFLVEGNDKPKYERRDIQVLKIVVKYYDHDKEGLVGWYAKIFVENAYDLNAADKSVYVTARNEKSFVSDTIKEAIKLAGRNCLFNIMSCANQVAKICDCTVTSMQNED